MADVLFGLENLGADGLPMWRGRSAGVLEKTSREVVSLVWAERDNGGRYAPGVRTVRRSG
jgi:hypothetical protein